MTVSSEARRRPYCGVDNFGDAVDVYTKNIARPRTDPWGTPDVTGKLSDSAPCTTTDCVLPLRKLLIHSSVVESMPYSCSDDMSLL